MEETTVPESERPLSLNALNKHIKLTIIVAIVTAMITGILSSIGFYYKTTYKIENLFDVSNSNARNIDQLTKTVNDISTQTQVLEIQPVNMNKQIDELTKRIDNLQDKQDKIYDLLLTLQKQK